MLVDNLYLRPTTNDKKLRDDYSPFSKIQNTKILKAKQHIILNKILKHIK